MATPLRSCAWHLQAKSVLHWLNRMKRITALTRRALPTRLVPGDESDAIAQVVDPIAGPSCTQIVRGKTWRDISLAKLSQKYLDRLDHLDRA